MSVSDDPEWAQGWQERKVHSKGRAGIPKALIRTMGDLAEESALEFQQNFQIIPYAKEKQGTYAHMHTSLYT